MRLAGRHADVPPAEPLARYGKQGDAAGLSRKSTEHKVTEWLALPYDVWSATCDTLHARTQVLGKLAPAPRCA